MARPVVTPGFTSVTSLPWAAYELTQPHVATTLDRVGANERAKL